MTNRIAAWSCLAFALVGLLTLSSSCNSTGGNIDDGTGGSGSGGAAGARSGGTTQTGGGGDVGGQVGGGPGRGGSGGGRGGTSDASIGGGGSAGRDAAAGGRGGSGRGGSTTTDGGKGGARAIDGGPVACDDIESSGRLAVYYYSDSAVEGSSIQMHFDIVNFTAFTSRLSQVTVRYWFTDEEAASANIVEQYYVPIPTTMKFITLNPPRTDADTVLEMSFRDVPDAGLSWVETRGFNFAFHKKDYAGNYDQSNDYSYDAKVTKALGRNARITAYVNGVLAWGCEPPVQKVVVDAGVVDAGAVETGKGAEDAGTGG
jgi:hypothetical protein